MIRGGFFSFLSFFFWMIGRGGDEYGGGGFFRWKM